MNRLCVSKSQWKNSFEFAMESPTRGRMVSDLFSERQISEAPRERELLGRRLKERETASALPERVLRGEPGADLNLPASMRYN